MKKNIQEQGRLMGVWRSEIFCLRTWNVKRKRRTNLIPSVGKEAFAAQFSNQNSEEIGNNQYVAVGNDATTVDASDTTLGNETARKAASSQAFASNVASVATFFAATEATGTHREYGLFGSGNTTTASATVDTGILYSHVNANDTVGATETLTLTFEFTFG